MGLHSSPSPPPFVDPKWECEPPRAKQTLLALENVNDCLFSLWEGDGGGWGLERWLICFICRDIYCNCYRVWQLCLGLWAHAEKESALVALAVAPLNNGVICKYDLFIWKLLEAHTLYLFLCFTASRKGSRARQERGLAFSDSLFCALITTTGSNTATTHHFHAHFTRGDELKKRKKERKHERMNTT